MGYLASMTDKIEQPEAIRDDEALAIGATTTAEIAQAAAEVQIRQQDEPTVDPVAPRERYFNRELSWLAFNERVLDEACNTAHPLLERLRFLSISGANLDEFFMVRVAGLRGQQVNGVEQLSADGLTPAQQLGAIAESADRLMQRQQEVRRVLRDELATRDFHILHGHGIHEDEAEWLEAAAQVGQSLPPDLVLSDHDVELTRSAVSIETSQCGRFEATHFGIPPRTAVFLVLSRELRRFGRGERAFEVARIEYRGDVLQFHLELGASASTGGLEATYSVSE